MELVGGNSRVTFDRLARLIPGNHQRGGEDFVNERHHSARF